MRTQTTVTNNIEAIKEHLESLTNEELKDIHNLYCEEENYPDDEIYDNDDDFFETYFDGKVIEAIRATQYGEYSYGDKYVKFNGYANLDSFNDVSEQVDIDSIANSIMENPDAYDIELIEEETDDTAEETNEDTK